MSEREYTEKERHKIHDWLRSVTRYDSHIADWYPKTTLDYITHLEAERDELLVKNTILGGSIVRLEAELAKARDAISAIRIALLEPKLSDSEKLSSIKVSIKSLDWKPEEPHE